MMRAGTITASVAGVLASMAATHAPAAARWGGLIDAILVAAAVYFLIDFVLLTRIPRDLPSDHPVEGARGILARIAGSAGLVDLAAMLALPLPLLAGLPPETAHLFGMVWLLKLVRYASGLALLGRVIRNGAEALLSVLLCFVIILVAAATAAFLAEGAAQPEQFGSIPLAIWWAIVTLTTTGYGDAVPVTLPGRALAGVVMICGIGVFALWAGIIASGFTDELRRRDFLRNWELVAKVPFFHDLGAEVIAEVARLLRRRDVSKGQAIVRRGQPGEAMFFIVVGTVEVQIEPRPLSLGEGHFFGEMALITDAPRNATVVAATPCLLLELDVADFRRLSGERPELMTAIAAEAKRRLGASKA